MTKVNKKTKKLKFNNFAANPAIVNKRTCPAVILAANRIAKLKTRIKYEKSSITTSIGNKNKGTSGTKKRKKPRPFSKKPSNNEEHQTIIEKKKVKTICAVGEKLKGTNPNKLLIKINKKSNKKKGKKTKPFVPICLSTCSKTKDESEKKKIRLNVGIKLFWVLTRKNK